MNMAASRVLAHAPGLAGGTALPLLLGLLVLYAPIYAELSRTLWQEEAQSHAPVIALVAAALFWQLRQALAALPAPRHVLSGAALLGGGLLLAVAGRNLEMPLLSMASQMPVLAGILLVLRGTAGLRLAAFPLLFLAFMVPLPGMVVEAMTGQLKELLSAASVNLLHALGYPAARSGVVIVVGQYQLLMADACSGLHSLFSLAALGLLYVHLTARRDEAKTGGTGGGPGDGYRGAHAALLLAAILPVALAANLLRVVLLILVTYHGGDALGRQIHEAMGVLVFLVALALLFAVDGALLALARRSAAGAHT